MLAMPVCLKDFEPHSRILNVASSRLNLSLNGHPLIAALEAENRNSDLEAYDSMSDIEKAAVERAISNYHACGFMYWYDWSNQNWGTKWNAYSQPENGFDENATEFHFQTAWAHPIELIAKMSAFLPEVTFEVLFADEDTGSNCGKYTIKSGSILEENIAPSWSEQTPEQKKKFTEFAFTLCNPDTDPRSYGYDENWVYSDEVAEQYEAEQAA